MLDPLRTGALAAAHPGQCPYVILMPVCDDDSLYLVLPGGKEGCVWQNLLHPKVCEAAGGNRVTMSAGIHGQMLQLGQMKAGCIKGLAAFLGITLR